MKSPFPTNNAFLLSEAFLLLLLGGILASTYGLEAALYVCMLPLGIAVLSWAGGFYALETIGRIILSFDLLTGILVSVTAFKGETALFLALLCTLAYFVLRVVFLLSIVMGPWCYLADAGISKVLRARMLVVSAIFLGAFLSFGTAVGLGIIRILPDE